MTEVSLADIEATIKAKMILELELHEFNADFIVVKVDTGLSQHLFCLPKAENIAHLVIHYMDEQNRLRGRAQELEVFWNALAFEQRILTAWLTNHPKGLELIADFRYSLLTSETAWQAALSKAGLKLLEEKPLETPQARHLILERDSSR